MCPPRDVVPFLLLGGGMPRRPRARVAVTAGHYGVVRVGERRKDRMRVAVKTVPKRRAVYVDMLRCEVDILRVRAPCRWLRCTRAPHAAPGPPPATHLHSYRRSLM